ncbi:tripartite motif containing protein thin isoform X3 [Rhodnius prolixus]|uniref:tripartite motif containing protein thin isoform X3 n=1 Tax=Rhodnius prolixus TaxID=13249 RepID=UPI003D18DF54
MEQFEQLLTCAICLDRYRNPKLLPCQHSFCMEPCMDGLVDYVRRQVKCPECRAEHRIPYQGVQGYPTNVTLQRFLELHIEITGEMPDPTSGQIMKRCAVCTEKAYCIHCYHCSKDVCPLCKSAHMDILRREISRINNQVRRALHRLEDVLSMVEKNTTILQNNCTSVSEEVDEIYRRLAKALKDRTDYLRGEVDRYLAVELRNLNTLKDNLEQEISNIQSNCDLADKHMQSEDVEWDDSELLDTKEIFLKTVDFIRNFEAEMGDYTRRVRFTMTHDPNQLVMHVSTYGDLNISMPHQFVMNQQAQQAPGLMRSKSDHRLAAQYRQQEDRYERDEGRVSPLNNRKFGERYTRRQQERDYDYGDYEESRPSARSRLRRLRHGGDNTDSDNDTNVGRSVRFEHAKEKEREKVLDTEDVAKGPLSGITRLYDCPRVMKRLKESEVKKDRPEPPPQPVQQQQQPKAQPKRQPPVAQRQVSEEDEITKIKRQMKNAPGEPREPERPGADRVTALRREEDRPTSPQSARSSPGSDQAAKQTPPQAASSSEESDESPPASLSQSPSQRKTSATRPPVLAQGGSRRSSASSDVSSTVTGSNRVTGVSTPPIEKSTPKEEDEDESSSEEETSSEESSSEEEVPVPVAPKPTEMAKTDIGPLLARSAQARRTSTDESYQLSPTRSRYNDSTYRPTYGRDTHSSRISDESSTAQTAPWRTRSSAASSAAPSTQDDDTTSSSRYGPGGFTSRFLNKSKSSAAVSPEEEDPGASRRFGTSTSNTSSSSSSAQSPRSRYSALKADRLQDRKSRLARSKSTHNLGDDDDEEDVIAANSPAAYLANRYGSDLSRSRSSHAIKSREPSPDRPASSGTGALGSSSSTSGVGEKDGAALSSWARYLKNKYGARGKESGAGVSNSRRLSLGLPLRTDNSDDDQKNSPASPTSPTQHPLHQGFAVGSSTRVQYAAKRRQVFSVGSRGSEPGSFTWPRGVATGPENSIVVADSSNHRVQVFDSNGIFHKEFGSYGNGEGEFDCLAGVAVNRIGQFIIADRYNHRIQVMDPSGRFLRAFGSQGTADGKFNYPWGVTTDALGFIYVCDKENHRVQVFQSDGTFVGKFGCHGSKIGQLDHPHYIAVSNTNRVIVSDSNNHRVQIFDVNGRLLSSFGQEGSEEGQFKFPSCERGRTVYGRSLSGPVILPSTTSLPSSSSSPPPRRSPSPPPRRSPSPPPVIQRSISLTTPPHTRMPTTVRSSPPRFPRSLSLDSSPTITAGISIPRPYLHDLHTSVVGQSLVTHSSPFRSSSGRPGLHTGWRFRQQSDPDIHLGRRIHPSVWMLGERRGRIQGIGGSGSHVKLQHTRVRPGKPQDSSILENHLTGSTEYLRFDSPSIKKIKIAATVPAPRYRRQSLTIYPSTASSIYQRRMSIS